jgi:transcriptional regulator with PAS, ATPase and Fis domain
MILGEGDWITSSDLPRAVRQEVDLATPVGDDLREALRAYEKAHIQSVLAKVEHDKKVAAQRLGMSLSSLYRKMEELEIDLNPGQASGPVADGTPAEKGSD